MRKTLHNARKNANLKQKDLAKKLGVTPRQYQRIESGDVLGKVDMWDTLEDLFKIPQRQLREIEQPDANLAEKNTHQNDTTKKGAPQDKEAEK